MRLYWELNFRVFPTTFLKNHILRYGIKRLERCPISVTKASLLERPFEKEEIKIAIWTCCLYKSPSPYGYLLAVYQDYWDVLNQDLLAVFREFYKSGVVNSSTNSTFIRLIPKKKKPSKLNEFRPISLVTSLYKIIYKVFSLRLKKVLEETISYSQGAFVRDR